MKIIRQLLILTALVALSAFAVGCASMSAPSTERLLSAAGFQTRTPTTPKQQALYAQMTPYKVHRMQVGGKVIYAYKDLKSGLLYIGGEYEYQSYQNLGVQQSVAQENLAAAQLNEETSLDWAGWGPMGVWW